MATETRTERVIFIEYRDRRPFTVITDDGEGGNEYDVEYCKRDRRLYYHLSGFGGYTTSPLKVHSGSVFWAAPDVPLEIEEGATRLKRAIGKRIFERALAYVCSKGVSEGETEYCPTCDDYLPSGDSNDLCAHCCWCGESSDWSKPGDRCPWDCEECRVYGREVKPPPGPILIAQGYGAAASPLASLARRLLSRHGLTPETLGERMRCDDWAAGARMALRGEVHPEVDRRYLERLARALGMDEAERDELFEVFGLTEESNRSAYHRQQRSG